MLRTMRAPVEEVTVRDEAVDEVEVVPRDATLTVCALADRLDVRLDRFRTSFERFPNDAFASRNAFDQSRFSFSSRSVIRSFFVIQIPSPRPREEYDAVIHPACDFWRV